MRFSSPSLFVFLSTAIVAACSGGDAAVQAPGTDAGNAPQDGGVRDGNAVPDASSGPPEVIFPRTGITAEELGVLVNDADPLSVSIAAYYVAARKIPAANVVHLTLTSTGNTMPKAELEPLKAQVDAALATTKVEALAITWTKPFAVDNMSITSAFAMGYRAIGDTCNDPASQAGSLNPYAKKRATTHPFTDLAFRPAMTIPATTLEQAKALIDRGVASDDTWPGGSAYLMNTSDQTRSARCIVNAGFGWTNECQTFLNTWDPVGSGIGAEIVKADFIEKKTDVLFYVQGLASVANITTNTFLPGAVADHLTSYGGQIPTSGQMSAFEFIKGGATGSFGTVVEPCAYQQKFPDPSVLIPSYFGGSTLVEAYWRSVLWPAEGIFIGEPLARPFGSGFRSRFEGGALTIETTALVPGHKYVVEAADSDAGPFTTVLADLSVPKYQRAKFTVPDARRHTYRFRE